MKVTFCWATVALVALSAAVSEATQIARDSFAVSAGGNDYDPLISIVDQDPTVGAHGFVGPWGNCCTQVMVPVSGGLTHPLTPGAQLDGQLIVFPSNGSAGGGGARNLSRAIDYTPVAGTYYTSVLLQKNAADNRSDLLAGLGRSQAVGTSIFAIAGTWVGFVDGGISFFSGPGPDYLTQLLSRAETRVNETYFALMRYDYTLSGSDTVTVTIFDGSENEVASQTFPGINLGGSLGRFSVFTQDYGPIPAVDEWRFGTELRDVMVPEPSSLILLVGLATVGILANREWHIA